MPAPIVRSRHRKARITLAAVRSLSAGTALWDTDIKGFGVRLQSQTPSYFLKTRIAGRQRWITIGKHGSPFTPEMARDEALRLLLEARAGREPPKALVRRHGGEKGPLTLADAVARYEAEHGPKLKSRTRDLYGAAFKRLIVPKLGKLPIAEIGPEAIARFHVGLVNTPRQANSTLTVLSSLIGWAMDMRLRPRGENPCASIKRFKENKRERFLSLPELERVATAIHAAEASGEHSIHALAALRLLILTGARLGEILTLRWSHVALDDARLSLPDSKTGAKTIALNAQAIDVLRSLPRIPDNPFVIPGKRRGTHMVNIHTVWDAIRSAAGGLDDVRIHDLRHSFASFAVNAGASLPLIGKLLGHNSPSTTARYAHIADRRASEVNENVGEIIGAAMSRGRPAGKPAVGKDDNLEPGG